jgi:superfamily II DNA or RNA helicase
VVIREGARGLVTWCNCSHHSEHGEACKHIVATLVAWIARRDGGSVAIIGEPDEEAPPPDEKIAAPIQNLKSLIRLVKRAPAGDGSGSGAEILEGALCDPATILSAILPRGVPVRVKVDRGGHTHGFVVSFNGSGGAASRRRRKEADAGNDPAISLTIPPGDVSTALRELDELPDVKWTDSAGSLRVYYSPVRMRLRADYAQSGVLVLTPIAQVRDSSGTVRIIEPVHLHEGLDGTMWVEDGPHTLRRVGLWTSLMEQYSPDFKPRILEGIEVVDFLRHGHETKWRGGLDPSERVKSSRVFNEVKLATVEVSEAPGGWLWLDPRYRAGDHQLALSDILEARRTGGLLRKGDDWIVLRSSSTWSRGGTVHAASPAAPDPISEAVPDGAQITDGRIQAPRLAYLRQRAEWGSDVDVRTDTALSRFEAFLRREGPPPPAPKLKGMVGRLRPYQKAGYRWLWFLRESGLGGILADEMGLGKTHQVMALLLGVYNQDGESSKKSCRPGPALVVCPRSVLEHWDTKVLAHAPTLEPLVYHGTEREHARANLPRRRVVLTTYGVLSRDVDHLAEVQWEYVILDEAQYIKNTATKASRAVRKLHSSNRLALTGTPMENHIGEIRSIMDFVLPGYLGSTDWFRKRFSKPVEEGDATALEVLKRALEPFKLRRTKSQVLTDLPPKIEDVRFAALTPHQAVIYREILVRARSSGLMDRLGDPSQSIDYVHVFSVLSQLKRLCDHPYLVLEEKPARPLTSGKFEAFKELIGEALEAGEKVVVFSQYLGMLDLIEEHLAGIGVKYSGLRGATRRRAAAIRTFQNEPDCRVFVASLLAGGLGVDLTAGSVVIHYDRWWNAAREDQATDRVHRIGQSRGVQVFRLITRGTLEDRIDGVIGHKRRLADRLLETDPAMGLKFISRKELLEILQPPEIPKETAAT